MKLGCWRNYQKGRADIDTMLTFRNLRLTFVSSSTSHRCTGSLCFMDIELCRALERGMKGPASIKQPLISIYDTLIITFDPLCNPAVIKNNFSSLLVFASNVKTLNKHFESKISSKITIDNILSIQILFVFVFILLLLSLLPFLKSCCCSEFADTKLFT